MRSSRSSVSLRRAVMIVVFLAMSATLSFGFRSGCLGDTHRTIAQRAVEEDRLSADAYPDLWRFREQLIQGSDSEDGHPNIIANNASGDSLTQFWAGAKDFYGDKQFTDAYFLLGVMGHLTQDEANPAHAFDIQHVAYHPGWRWPHPYRQASTVLGDHLETYVAAEEQLVFDPDPVGIQVFDDPTEAYLDMIDDTRNVVFANIGGTGPWVGPTPPALSEVESKWNQYWGFGGFHQETVTIPGFVPTTTRWFNGDFGPNAFPAYIESPKEIAALNTARVGQQFSARDRYPDTAPTWFTRYYTPFAHARIAQAVRFTAGCWAAASKKLPPLVRDLGDPPVIGGVHIEFTILENRLATLQSLVILVDGAEYERDDGYVLQANPVQTQLPWKSDVTRVLLLAPGTHIIEIVVTDGDGNVGTKGEVVVVPPL